MSPFLLTPDSVEEIINSHDEDIIVTNHEGIVVKATRISGRLYGLEPEELIGKSVYDLQKDEIFSPAITPLVLEQKKKVVMIQTTPSGAKVLITGIPFFNDKKEVEYVVSYSYNVSDLLVIHEYMDELEYEMAKAKEELQLLRQQTLAIDGLVTESIETKEAFATARKVAPLHAPVVLYGEPGTGKTTMAKLIHKESLRNDGPFIELDCAIIPESLFEKEVFGEESSSSVSPGILAVAEGGTLFLKNVDRLPLHLQGKLLQVWKQGGFRPVGSKTARPLDVRVITSAETNLRQQVDEKRFLEELYYVLHIVPIMLQPLRDRKEDISLLISQFLYDFSQKYGTNKTVSMEVFQLLLDQPWKGNISELRNVMERLVVHSSQDILTLHDIPPEYQIQPDSSLLDIDLEAHSLPSILEHVEMQVLKNAQKRFKTTTEMAKGLGISQPSVVRKLKKYTLPE